MGGVDGGTATQCAYGSFADNKLWRSRGFGKFLLHLVQRELQSKANGRNWRLELQSSREMLSWYTRRGFEEHKLSVTVESIDDCQPMRLAPGSTAAADAYARFLAGADGDECCVSGQLLTAWSQIQTRDLGVPYVDEVYGYSLVANQTPMCIHLTTILAQVVSIHV